MINFNNLFELKFKEGEKLEFIDKSLKPAFICRFFSLSDLIPKLKKSVICPGELPTAWILPIASLWYFSLCTPIPRLDCKLAVQSGSLISFRCRFIYLLIYLWCCFVGGAGYFSQEAYNVQLSLSFSLAAIDDHCHYLIKGSKIVIL